ncbi:MAG: hypothetical protein ACK5F7_12485, partial [Planctomycetaceae bacterium]
MSSNPGSVQSRRGRCAGGVERAWHATRDERHLSTGVPVMVSVFIPPAWRDLTGDVVEVNVAAGTVRQLVNALEERFPGLRERAVMDDALRHIHLDHVARQIAPRGRNEHRHHDGNPGREMTLVAGRMPRPLHS